jgi:hypothetical protein
MFFTGEQQMEPINVESLQRLKRDVKTSFTTLTVPQARYLVDSYYTIQEYRKASGNQVFALTGTEEPHEVISWLQSQTLLLEGQIKNILDGWSNQQPLGQWARSITGIGPVIASGLLAHIDIMKAPTVGHIWRFAGLDPTSVWGKRQKRPWNAALKVLCWKIGESFVKVSTNANDVYGKVYIDRKGQEQAANEVGTFAEQAKKILETRKIGHDTDAYKAYSIGKLPPAHIHARAKRYAVKLFLAHYHHVAYELQFKTAPPRPYVIEHLGHVHFIAPPNYVSTVQLAVQ